MSLNHSPSALEASLLGLKSPLSIITTGQRKPHQSTMGKQSQMETITNTHNQHVSFFTITFEWQKPETNVTSIFGGLWFK